MTTSQGWVPLLANKLYNPIGCLLGYRQIKSPTQMALGILD